MCGFAGIWWGEADPPRDADAIAARMVASIAHRGPDEGSWIRGPRGIVGFRRLSIIDPAGGHQPVRSPGGRIEALLNGEIYNHRDLRPAVEADDGPLPSGSDAEVIPGLYRRHGDAFVERLSGMFAICVADHERRRLVLWRDRFGIKPMFHARVGPWLLFGSELKSILASGLLEPEIDRASLAATLERMHAPGPWTMVAGIRSLPPGGRLTMDADGQVRVDRWIRRDPQPHARSERPDPARLRAKLDEAVAAQLVADVPLGIALSGGIDSTLLAESAARVRRPSDPPLTAITVDGPGMPPEEVAFAAATAARLGMEHRVVHIAETAINDRLPEVAWAADEPVTDPATLSSLQLCEAAASQVRVLLLGAGGDELFGGYPGMPVRWSERLWAAIPERVRARLIDRLAAGDPRRRDRLEAMGRTRRSRIAMHLLLRSELPPQIRRELGGAILPGPGSDRDPVAAVREAFDVAIDCDLLTQQLHADLETYLPDQLLAMLDRTSMAAGIEGRVPLLDERFAAEAMAIHGRWKIGAGGTGKRILRSMLEPGAGAALARRPKSGFASPVAAWLGTEMPSILGRLIEDPRSISASILTPGWIRGHLDRTISGSWRDAGWLHGLTMIELWHRLLILERRVDRPTESIDHLLTDRPAARQMLEATPAPIPEATA